MNWNELKEIDQLGQIKEESGEIPVLIFKHSTRCSISSTSLNRLERKWDETEMNGLKSYYLDLIQYRDISNQIAETFGVAHQSPQVLVIKNGESIYDESHFGIDYDEIRALLG